jgi:serine/threonine-protein kinase HipA
MKTKKIEVFYGDLPVGELRDFGSRTGFAYAPEFLKTGHPLSPLGLPLESRVFVFDDPDMLCLPGIFCDSVPDAYGRRIMWDWYAKKMGGDYAVTAADMLAYVGQNGMGALRYEPSRDEFDAGALRELDLARASHEAKSYLEGRAGDVLESLRASVKTAGGSFPKALVSIDPATGHTYEFRAGLPATYEHWIVKFGVADQRATSDFTNYPEVELAYMDMARDCGINVPETRVFATPGEDGKQLVHCGVRRFDLVEGSRLHYASLSGLKDLSAEDPYWDYRHLLEVTQTIVADYRAMLEQCRRMIFNVAAANFDDHAKNHGFLYDGKEWTISPAFDLSYWGFRLNASQSLAVSGRIKAIDYAALEALSCKAGLKKKEVREIADQIRHILEKAPAYLDKWGVPRQHHESIATGIKRQLDVALQ